MALRNAFEALALDSTLTNGTARVRLLDSTGQPIGSASNPVQVAQAARTLTERMKAWAPTVGYEMWTDLIDPLFIYLAEAPVGATGTATTFRGIRIPVTTAGRVIERTNFAWDSRTTGWV